MTFYIKQNDTFPVIRATLRSGNGDPIDLDSATVRFHMRQIGSNTVKIDAAGGVVLASDGVVQYIWSEDDTDTVGAYQAEFEVTYPGGSVETFPNDGYIRVEITDDIT